VTTQPTSFLATGRGGLTFLLLCAVQFLDVADSSIMNVPLPSIRRGHQVRATNRTTPQDPPPGQAEIFIGPDILAPDPP
jgi:hypothetical protein